MSQAPQGRAYALSAEQHHYLSQKAVALTQTLDRPVNCRHVLDVLLELSLKFDDKTLAQQLQLHFSAPRHQRKSRRRE